MLRKLIGLEITQQLSELAFVLCACDVIDVPIPCILFFFKVLSEANFVIYRYFMTKINSTKARYILSIAY